GKAEDAVNIEPRAHARGHGDVPGRRQRQRAAEALGVDRVVARVLVGDAHWCRASFRAPVARSAGGRHFSIHLSRTDLFTARCATAYVARADVQALLRAESTPDSRSSCAVRLSPRACAASASDSLKKASSAGLTARFRAVNASPQS